jgi:hypothetical protein
LQAVSNLKRTSSSRASGRLFFGAMPPPKTKAIKKPLEIGMKFLTSILLPVALMLAFVAAPINTAVACGGSESCCKKGGEKEKGNNSCCESKTDNSKPCNEEKDCGGDCGKKGCHCPSTFSTAQLAVPIPLKLAFPNFCPPKKAAWYYLNKIPKAVYLAIWLPPKISC